MLSPQCWKGREKSVGHRALRLWEGGRGPPWGGGSLPASFRAARSLPWGHASQMWVWAATSCWQSSSWLPALFLSPKCAWAPHRSAPTEPRGMGWVGRGSHQKTLPCPCSIFPVPALSTKGCRGVHAPISSPLPISPPGHSLPAGFLGRKHPS